MAAEFAALLDDLELARRVRDADPGLAHSLTYGGAGGGAPARDDAWIAELRDPVARARTTQTSARSQAELAKALAAAEGAVVQLTPPPPTREQRITAVRQGAQNLMSKALAAFEAGEVTAVQVAELEHRCALMVQRHVDAPA